MLDNMLIFYHLCGRFKWYLNPISYLTKFNDATKLKYIQKYIA